MLHTFHKLSIAAALCVAAITPITAQGIRFETSDFTQTLEKAKTENKLVFIDCYTTWCGPCKQLAKKVFPDKSAGDFFNEHYVSLKMDVEREGKKVGRKYKVSAMPTLLFIDPHSQEVLNRVVGYVEPTKLIEEGKKALNPHLNLKGCSLRYQTDKQNTEAAMTYLNSLKAASLISQRDSILQEYLSLQPDEQRHSEKNWQLLSAHTDNVYTPAFDYLYKESAAFEQTVGKEAVNQKMSTLYQQAIFRFIRRKRIPEQEFAKKDFKRLQNYVQTYNGVNSDFYKAQIAMIDCVQKGDYRAMLKSLEAVDKKGGLNPQNRFYFIWLNLTYLSESKDTKALNMGLEWADKIKPNSTDKKGYRIWLKLKANLYAAKGDTKQAHKLNEEILSL